MNDAGASCAGPALTAQSCLPGAPGPSGTAAFRWLLALRRDPLSAVVGLSRAYGPVVRIPLSTRSFYLLSHHTDARRVLTDNARNYAKATWSFEELKSVLGDGLVTSDGARWREQRRSVNAAFQRSLLPRLAPIVIDGVESLLLRWQRTKGPLDLSHETRVFALEVVTRAVLGTAGGAVLEGIDRHLSALLSTLFERTLRPWNWPRSWPTRENQLFRRHLAALDRAVLRLIAARRSETGSGADLLGQLLSARGADGAPLSDSELRDQVTTFLLAGHETVGSLLAFALAQLALRPAVEAKLSAELKEELQGRAPRYEDLQRLEYCRCLVEETARLYPPVWLIERRALADDALSGYRVPKGASVAVCQYALHRDPLVWPEPDRFLPERFSTSERGARPAHAFLPFGAGARSCIGGAFAMMEAMLAVARIAQSVRLRLVLAAPPQPAPGITLRPRGPLWVTLQPTSHIVLRG